MTCTMSKYEKCVGINNSSDLAIITLLLTLKILLHNIRIHVQLMDVVSLKVKRHKSDIGCDNKDYDHQGNKLK